MRSIPSKSIRRGVARLRILSRPLKNRLSGIATRSINDYATHIPILVGIAQRFKIRRVLELGCGAFSTSTFLNREIFADLDRLDSYETDRLWLDKTATAFQADDRFRPRLTSGAMASGLRDAKLEIFDLIFVDDSSSADERKETIRQLANQPQPGQLIVIHDFEIGDYRDAASSFEHRQIFRAFTPQTGVVWNGSPQPVAVLKKLNRQIIHHSKNIPVDDLTGWRRVLRAE